MPPTRDDNIECNYQIYSSENTDATNEIQERVHNTRHPESSCFPALREILNELSNVETDIKRCKQLTDQLRDHITDIKLIIHSKEPAHKLIYEQYSAILNEFVELNFADCEVVPIDFTDEDVKCIEKMAEEFDDSEHGSKFKDLLTQSQIDRSEDVTISKSSLISNEIYKLMIKLNIPGSRYNDVHDFAKELSKILCNKVPEYLDSGYNGTFKKAEREELKKVNMFYFYMCKKHKNIVNAVLGEDTPVLKCSKCGLVHKIDDVDKICVTSFVSFIKLIVKNGIYKKMFDCYTYDEIMTIIKNNEEGIYHANLLKMYQGTYNNGPVDVKTYEDYFNTYKVSQQLQAYKSEIDSKKPEIILLMKMSADGFKLNHSGSCIKEMFPIILHPINLKKEYAYKKKYTIPFSCAKKEYFLTLLDYLLYEVNFLSSGDFVVMDEQDGSKKKVMTLITQVSADTPMLATILGTPYAASIFFCKYCNIQCLKGNNMHELMKMMCPKMAENMDVYKTPKERVHICMNNKIIFDIDGDYVWDDFLDNFKEDSTKDIPELRKEKTLDEIRKEDKGFSKKKSLFEKYPNIKLNILENNSICALHLFYNICSKIMGYLLIKKKDDKTEFIGLKKEDKKVLDERFKNLHSIDEYSKNKLNNFISGFESNSMSSWETTFVCVKILPMLLHNFNENDSPLVPLIQLMGSVISNLLALNIPNSYDAMYSIQSQILVLLAYMEAILDKRNITTQMHMLVHCIPELLYGGDMYLASNAISESFYAVIKRLCMSMKNPSVNVMKRATSNCISSYETGNEPCINNETMLVNPYKPDLNKLNSNTFYKTCITSLSKYLVNNNDVIPNQFDNEQKLLKDLKKNIIFAKQIKFNSKTFDSDASQSNITKIAISNFDRTFMLHDDLFPHLVRALFFIQYNGKYYVAAKKYLNCQVGPLNSYFTIPSKSVDDFSYDICVLPLNSMLPTYVIVTNSYEAYMIDNTDLSEKNKKKKGNNGKISLIIQKETIQYSPKDYLYNNGITNISSDPFIYTNVSA